jgi:hypothetical protein
MENLPTFIQVGMGTAVSSRRLAQAVSQLGVVSGTALSMSRWSVTDQKTPTSGECAGVTHFIPYPRVEFDFETEFVSRASNSRRVRAPRFDRRESRITYNLCFCPFWMPRRREMRSIFWPGWSLEESNTARFSRLQRSRNLVQNMD